VVVKPPGFSGLPKEQKSQDTPEKKNQETVSQTQLPTPIGGGGEETRWTSRVKKGQADGSTYEGEVTSPNNTKSATRIKKQTE